MEGLGLEDQHCILEEILSFFGIVDNKLDEYS